MQFCDQVDDYPEPADIHNLKCMVFVTFLITYSLVAFIILVLYISFKIEIAREKKRRIQEDKNYQGQYSPQSKTQSKYGKFNNGDRTEGDSQTPWKSINQNNTVVQTSESNYNPLGVSNPGNIYKKTNSMMSQNDEHSIMSRVAGKSFEEIRGGTFHSRNRSTSRQQLLLRPDKRLSFGMLDEDEQQSTTNENLLTNFNSSSVFADLSKTNLRK